MQHKAGNILLCINGHLGDSGAQGSIALAGEADFHRRAQGLTVRAQQLFGLLCGAHPGVLPAEPGHQLTYTAIQRHLGVGVQISLELLRLCAKMSAAPAFSRPLLAARTK